jgi:tellurite resistance protein TerC
MPAPRGGAGSAGAAAGEVDLVLIPTLASVPGWAWGGFLAFVVAMLALDLGVFHRKSHEVRAKEALAWSLVWIGLALAVNAGVWAWLGRERGLEFLSGYLIEKSLSVDNIFVFAVIFGALRIPAVHQHRVLFWGILTALVLRGVMIFAGVALLERFHWLIYVFGAFLVLTGGKLLVQKEKDPEQGLGFRIVRRFVPATTRYDGSRFLTVENGRRVATPLLVALLLVEFTDVVFAIDSIPAIFAVTTDPFIVFTSNIFAILGLRSLYFLLAGAVEKFHYLKVGLAAVLIFVGFKMALVDVVKIPPTVSLPTILGLLLAALLASMIRARRLATGGHSDRPPDA